jgi:hypothetical protein
MRGSGARLTLRVHLVVASCYGVQGVPSSNLGAPTNKNGVACKFRENAEKLPVYSFLRTDKLSSRRCLGPRSILLLLLRTYITWTPEADCSAPRAVAHADAGPAGLHR